MRRSWTVALALLCVLVLPPVPAFVPEASAAINLGDLPPSWDKSRSTKYRLGEKPIPGCEPPEGWTPAAIGDGDGEWCGESPTEWQANAIGTNNVSNKLILYQDAGDDDVVFTARITDSFSGSTEPFAALGIGLREAATQTAPLVQCQSLQAGATAIQVRIGEAGTYSTVNAAVGQARPRYCAVTRDADENDCRAWESADGSAWTQVAQAPCDWSDVLAYAVAASRSLDASLSATLDNVNLGTDITAIYTPDPPDPPIPPNHAPVWASIPNQNGTQGVAFTFNCSSFASDEDDDPLTFAASGLSGRGLAMSSACAITGTPNATAVSASPFNVTVTATDDEGAEAVAVFQITVIAAASGDIFTIPTASGSRIYNCAASGGAAGATWASIRTSGSGTTPGPGDIVQLQGGTHSGNNAVLTFRNCAGTASSPITIRNRPTDSQPATVSRTGGSSGGFIFGCDTCNNVRIDGSLKYSGAPAGVLGIDPTTKAEGRTQAGIIVTRSGGAARPSQYLRLYGLTATTGGVLVQGVTVDGVNHAGSGGGGICFSMNDHAQTAADNPGVWRDGVTFKNTYSKFCGNDGGEAFYLGPNASNGDIPLRNIAVDYNLIDTPARDCINLKSIYGGTNSVSHNHMYGCGQAGGATQNQGINLQVAASFTIDGNRIINPGGNCFQWNQQADNFGANSTVVVQNNVLHGCGQSPQSTGYGFRVTRAGSAPTLSMTIRNATLVGASGAAANCATPVLLINSILSGAGAVSGCTNTNNRTGTPASQSFQNLAGDDFRLTESSAARNSGTANCPATDILGVSRPQQGSCDQGAHEYAP